ncbi:MAG TPA: hypothetical protein VGA30_06450 [Actinomycetota bacterium]
MTFQDDVSVQRTLTIDFELPDEPPPWRSSDPYVIPLTLVRKEVLWSYDLTDEAGAVVPLLTFEQDCRLAWSALVVGAEGLLGRPLPAETREELLGLVRELPSDAKSRLAHVLAVDGPFGSQTQSNEAFVGLLDDLRSNFALLVPVSYSGSRRRVMRVSYTQPISRTGARALASLGWKSTRFRFPIRAPGQTSFHFLLSVPPDVQISRVQFSFRTESPQETVKFGAWDRSRCHLYLAKAPPQLCADIVVHVKQRLRGLVASAFLATLLTASALLTGAIFIDRLRTGARDPASFLVALVGIFAVLTARPPGENDLVSTLLAGTRLAVALAGIVTYMAAASLLLGFGGSALHDAWWSIAGSALAILFVVSCALVVSREAKGGDANVLVTPDQPRADFVVKSAEGGRECASSTLVDTHSSGDELMRRAADRLRAAPPNE